MRYEYLILEIEETVPDLETGSDLMVKSSDGTEKPAQNLEHVLNSYGADGWELVETSLLEWHQEEVTKFWQISTCRLIFKRPII